MAAIDIFNNNAFGLVSLTNAINKAPYVPGLLGMLGIFEDVPIRTATAVVEEKHGQIQILNTAARGAQKDVIAGDKRETRSFNVPHVPQYSTILAEDIQGIRTFGSETELQSVAQVVNDRLEKMRGNHEVTFEWHRIGALKGIVYDGDASTVLYNFFTEFDIVQNTSNFNWSATKPKAMCTDVIRLIAGALGGTAFGQIWCICGDTYFDGLVNHADVVAAYDRWRDGEMLRVSQLGPEYYSAAANGLMYGNIMFVNYRGQVGNTKFVPDTEAYYFPTRVRGVFQEILAPGTGLDVVNTRGRRLYASHKYLDHNEGVELKTQANVLAMNTRPACVIKSTISSYP